MIMMDFVIRLNKEQPSLAQRLTLANLTKFINLASNVYHRAHEVMNLTSTDTRLLPFLKLALKLDLDPSECEVLWNLAFPSLPLAHLDSASLIRTYGLHESLDKDTKVHEVYLTPPTKTCIVCQQPSGEKLLTRPRIDGYLYDLDGVHSAEFHTWGCTDCGAYYRPSYYTSNKERFYYTKGQGAHPEYYQVHCHFAMSHRLAKSFRQSQMLAHMSNFNIVNLFNLTHIQGQHLPTHSGVHITPKISQEVAHDGSDLFSLLRRCDQRGSVLHVRAKGTNADCFVPAMTRELYHIANHGLAFRDHFCSLCVRASKVEHDGHAAIKVIRAIVTDGLTIGHWRCTASSVQLEELAHRAGDPPPNGPCLNPLPKVTSRFCADHEVSLKGWCQAQPCTALAEPGSKSCVNERHQAAMATFEGKKNHNFSLKSMLNGPGSNLPSDPSVHLNPETTEIIDLDELHDADEAARDGGEAQPKITSACSRCRTHNDQLIVGTCGIILSRRTFYNAEAPSALRDYLVEAFPEGLPEVIFYDNACNLLKVIHNGDRDPAPFKHSIIPVDPFHHRAHKETDEFCQRYTDPKKFPDLQENGSWIFNASAGELSNIWYGGFASMCRNMQATRYKYFLEDMVEWRNLWLTDALSARKNVEYIGLHKF
ncbi:uncharacterized protein MELLADRAFT_84934 [Melampsora larici-populina 98AG31]|uniref:CxC5 like cysteine cluster associated with KDZ domain-containing protein n=1 Tax=Melampsora larici-populina (strain 98AG31 / pathotype 3-4-7) TaxID=747676 RepID=F4RHF4_MELLP|nr:uncharacterized protein MELLADRAFT_84934 [Melampsora larici-populina 98AG31]EGG08161.1 hypothetical protein MELLADRAFT_84934 [Melampsora larici-populina 98AG31]